MTDMEQRVRQAAAALPEDAPTGLREGLPSRAADAGVLDVAYASVDSPLGPLFVAATPKGLVRVAYSAESFDAVLSDLSSRVSPRVLEAPDRLDEIRRQLGDYFEGRRRRFELPIDWRLTRGFGRRVLQATARIRYGQVRSYAEMASRAGSPRAVRAAGNALGANPMPVVVPCHRVVRTGGGLGGYGGGLDRKQHLLRLEGALEDV